MIDNKTFVICGLIVALLIGVIAVFMASGDPDGLESTALVVQGQKTLTGGVPQDAEIHEETAGRLSYESPMPDYSLDESMGSVGGIIAIVIGTVLAFLIVLGFVYGIKMFGKPVK